MLPLLVILPPGENREQFVKEQQRTFNIPQYNVFTVRPEQGTLAIEKLRDLNSVFLTRTAELKLVVIDSFDLAGEEAQNSILKLLEEKTEQARFILFITNLGAVVSTIRSRTQTVNGVSENKSRMEHVFSENDLTFTGSYSFLLNPRHTVKTKEEALEKTKELTLFFERKLQQQPSPSYAVILQEILATRREIQNSNVNPQFAYDNLLIFVSKASSMK